MRKVLVTGATGFVGRYVCQALKLAGHAVRGATRGTGKPSSDSVVDEWVVIPEGATEREWTAALQGVAAVIHLAGRAHVMRDRIGDPLAEFRRVNVVGTQFLARASAAAGVGLFVFVSSVKVNGEHTGYRGTSDFDRLMETDPAKPVDPYSISKWEAECSLHEIAAATGLEVVVLRPPLVFGPGVGANFLSLMRLVDLGIPLPLGSVHNLRSLIYVENLADLLVLCVAAAQARNRTYLVRDVDISTVDLVAALAAALGRRARLVRFPPWILRIGARLMRREPLWERLSGSLVVDDSCVRRELSWAPPCSFDLAISRTALWYRNAAGGGVGRGESPVSPVG